MSDYILTMSELRKYWILPDFVELQRDVLVQVLVRVLF